MSTRTLTSCVASGKPPSPLCGHEPDFSCLESEYDNHVNFAGLVEGRQVGHPA